MLTSTFNTIKERVESIKPRSKRLLKALKQVKYRERDNHIAWTICLTIANLNPNKASHLNTLNAIRNIPLVGAVRTLKLAGLFPIDETDALFEQMIQARENQFNAIIFLGERNFLNMRALNQILLNPTRGYYIGLDDLERAELLSNVECAKEMIECLIDCDAPIQFAHSLVTFKRNLQGPLGHLYLRILALPISYGPMSTKINFLNFIESIFRSDIRDQNEALLVNKSHEAQLGIFLSLLTCWRSGMVNEENVLAHFYSLVSPYPFADTTLQFSEAHLFDAEEEEDATESASPRSLTRNPSAFFYPEFPEDLEKENPSALSIHSLSLTP